jgi:hypothetical protein
MRSGGGVRTAVLTSKTKADREVSNFWKSYVESGRGGFGYPLRNPLTSLHALRAIRKLPVVDAAAQSETPGGQEVRRVLDQKGPLGLPARWWGFAVCPITDGPADFLKTPDGKRLRYYLRRANAEGLSCRAVNPTERTGILERANQREQDHPNPNYRVTQPRNDDMLGHDLWLVAEDDTGEPLLLAVVAVDGQFAVLRYFRTLGDSERHSLSRYLAHQCIIEALTAEGVRWLIDTDPPAAQTNGVRLFQRNLGFRYVNIRRIKERPAR